VEGKMTGCMDNRLKYYKSNQSKIPSITGRVIPEAVFSRRNYLHTIYDKIKIDLAPFDSTQILNPIWVNSRGAIARFDRGSLEIRLIDVQECAKADLAILAFLIEVIKSLVHGKWMPLNDQMHLKTDVLVQIFNEVIIHSQDAQINQQPFLEVFGLSNPIGVLDLWRMLFEKVKGNLGFWEEPLNQILTEGNLSTRLMKAINPYSQDKVVEVYHQLGVCLSENKLFIPSQL
jgi:carboxylate-amine ligase